MRTRIQIVLLLMLIILSNGTSFGRRRHKGQKERTTDEKILLLDPLRDPNAPTYEHHCDCHTVNFGVIQKIPYLHANSDSIDINFSSVCIRCGMCATIAQKINETLMELHDMMEVGIWLNETETTLLLRGICDYAFKYHSLREVDGRRYIADRVPGAHLLSTSADGQWGERLRSLCNEYLNEIGEIRLYESWKMWCEQDEKTDEHDLINTLCRSAFSNILRDCRRMENVHGYELPCQTYYARAKIMAEYEKYK